MERDNSDIRSDPHLRYEFCLQESLDEFVSRVTSWLESAENLSQQMAAMRDMIRVSEPELVAQSLKPSWLTTLDPDTNTSEFYYLLGYTDRTQRLAQIDQEHAALKEALQNNPIPEEGEYDS